MRQIWTSLSIYFYTDFVTIWYNEKMRLNSLISFTDKITIDNIECSSYAIFSKDYYKDFELKKCLIN